MAWSSGGERGKPILGFLLRFFWGKCPTGITYGPKETSDNLEPLGTCYERERERERERASTLQQVRVP